MIRGMTFFHGDKNSATSGADFSSSSQGALDSRAVIGDLHNPGREKNRIVRGSWPQHFDGVLRSDRAGRPIPASAFHQMICCRPITMAIEQCANDPAVQDSLKSLVFFFRFPLSDHFAVFRKTANMQAVWICRAAAEANVSRRIFFLERLFHLQRRSVTAETDISLDNIPRQRSRP